MNRLEILQNVSSEFRGFELANSELVRGGHSPQESQERTTLFYCRSADTQESKSPVMGTAEDIAKHLANRPETSWWLVQPLLNCELGGAGLLTGDTTYWEVAWGLPLSLLKKGELAGCLLVKASGPEAIHVGSQQSKWIVVNNSIVKVPVSRTAEFAVDMLLDITTRVDITCPSPALFEWGLSSNTLYLFDYKAISVKASAAMLKSGTIRKRSAQVCGYPTLPDLSVRLSPQLGNAPTCFGRGAALSHVSTYAAIDGMCTVTFLDW